MTDEFKVDKKIMERGVIGAKYPNYVIKKPLIFSGFLIVIILFFIVLLRDGGSTHYYLSCPPYGPDCKNELWVGCEDFGAVQFCASEDVRGVVCGRDPVVCEMEMLPAGFESGERPSWLYENFVWLALLIPLCFVGLNHLIYNGGGKRVRGE